MLQPQVLFEDLGLKYLGPVDGHDEQTVEQALRRARDFGGPVLVHVITRKGFGYALAANNNFIVVGDQNAGDSINPHGQVFLYEKPKSGWASTIETKRFQPSGSGVHGVGYSVTATSSGAIFAGAPYTVIDGEAQGAVFGFFY